MSWYKKAQHQSEEALVTKIKGLLKKHPFFGCIMQDYHIPKEDLDNHLRITFTDLQGKFAEGNGEEIKLDRQLMDEAFFQKNFHFVVHEFYHWVKRRSEALFYFNDDEEVQSFTLSIAWELLHGHTPQEIQQVFEPIISGHFKDRRDALQLFTEMLAEACEIIRTFKGEVK